MSVTYRSSTESRGSDALDGNPTAIGKLEAVINSEADRIIRKLGVRNPEKHYRQINLDPETGEFAYMLTASYETGSGGYKNQIIATGTQSARAFDRTLSLLAAVVEARAKYDATDSFRTLKSAPGFRTLESVVEKADVD